ncbi:MAG: hypothetical protein JWN08_1543 [Frankiales bacterium]|jgi:hypothetical protein|nr:hypothetical protein [Frankiales bacterium]
MKTTMKVESETRDLVKRLSQERSLDYDETIRLGMLALERESRRERMRRESSVAAEDPEDRAEAARVMQDMEQWGAR